MQEFDFTTKTALNGPFYCPECDEEYYNGVKIFPDHVEYRINHHCPDSVKIQKPEEE